MTIFFFFNYRTTKYVLSTDNHGCHIKCQIVQSHSTKKTQIAIGSYICQDRM